MLDEIYKVKIEEIFEGPMDLLVHLVRKNEVDIHDIPVAVITDQYIEYIEWMKAMNIDLVGDFLVMASTLIHIKSKMLLPSHETDEEDPRMDIARPLAEYLSMKSAAQELEGRNLLGRDTFIREPDNKDFTDDKNNEIIKVGLFELIDAFKKIIGDIKIDNRIEFSADRISVKEKINEIIALLEKHKSLTFNEMFDGICAKSDIIITFLAVLEMVKLSLINIVQHVQTGIIRLFYI